MRIVFISHLSPVASTGPNYSVPGRIEAQSHIDEVFWVNLSGVVRDEWRAKSYFYDSSEFERFNLQNIEKVFPNIDLVVFEGFYIMGMVKLSKELRRRRIPYVIVPRSSLTHQALHNHSWLKKRIAHWLYFNAYCRHALAIQFLTNKELEDSGNRWNKRNLVISNGITMPQKWHTEFSNSGINAVFVGRIDVYQKGIDLLLDACKMAADRLRQRNFKLTIYGPTIIDYDYVKGRIESEGLDDFIVMGGEILGEVKKEVLKKADLFVLTSRFEGHPMGLIEALAYGVPALVTPGTNMADEIGEEKAGWVCEATAEDIKEQLLNIVDESANLKERGLHARQLASHYDWNKLAETFHKEINNIL